VKGLSLIIFGAVAVITGITLALMFIRKRKRDNLLDFDDFDTAVSDEEFEHFFGADSGKKFKEDEEEE
jgi:FAD/FMN-containing dehydrogenase